MLEAAQPLELSSGRLSEKQVAELFKSFKCDCLTMCCSPRKDHIRYCMHIYVSICTHVCECMFVFLFLHTSMLKPLAVHVLCFAGLVAVRSVS